MAKRIVIIDGKKSCSICKELLPISNFRKNTTLTCGLHSQCNSCECKGRNLHRKTKHVSGLSIQKAESLKTNFKLNADDYILMIKTQDNKCAICGDKESHIDFHTRKTKELAVDHNHETGEIRQLLCHACNMGIGLFKEDGERMLKAIKYLEKYKKEK